MKPKAILFDLDNTLSDRRAAIETFSDRLIQEYGHDFGLDDHEEIKACICKADQDGYRRKEDVFLDLVEALSWRNPPHVDDFLQFWFSEFPKCTQPMVKVEQVLYCLKSEGILLGLITNGSVRMQNDKIDRLQIRHFFDCIYISEAVKIKKPDARIFHLALAELRVKPGEAWFVGDHPVNDIAGAREVGMSTVWISDTPEWSNNYPIRPNAIIQSLDQLSLAGFMD